MAPFDMTTGGGAGVAPIVGLDPSEAIIDLFAGGGGASEAIFMATGRHPDLAVNHDEDAIGVHETNHPTTAHAHEDVWRVKPEEVLVGRRIGLLWMSPDCRHFSRASGGRAKWKKVRSLPGVGITWATRRRPRVICMENVVEITTWGPLLDDGMPCPKRIGRSWRWFVGRLRGLGYTVEWRALNAADFGAPTTRTRLFMVARCDGRPIRWPQPTHSRNPSMFEQRWRSAAECIDFDRPSRSIFDRDRPLAEATLRRIAHGMAKFVINNPDPFIVTVTHGRDGFRGQQTDAPLPTILGKGRHAVVTPFVSKFRQNGCGTDLRDPLHTAMAGATCHSLVEPFVATIDHQGNPNGVRAADEPVSTMTAKARHVVVEPFVAGCGGRMGQSPPKNASRDPLNTMTTKADQVLVEPFVAVLRNNATAHDLSEPLRTVAAQGEHHMLVAPTLIQTGYGEREGQAPRVPGLDKPLGTVVAQGEKHALVEGRIAAFMVQHNTGEVGHHMKRPVSTITATASQQGLVEADLSEADLEGARRVMAFLIRFNGTNIGQEVTVPLGTATTKERFALVMVDGVARPITDIRMRMLHWTELQKAQGFREGYQLDRRADGKVLGKTTIVRLIGNSVSPPPAAALLRSVLGITETAKAAA